MSRLSGRQDASKWTDLRQTSRARTASRDSANELATRMREAAELARRYIDLMRETNSAFQAQDEAGQDAMLTQLNDLESQTTLSEYEESVRPYINTEHLIDGVNELPTLLRPLFVNDAVIKALGDSVDSEGIEEYRAKEAENEGKKNDYFAYDQYFANRGHSWGGHGHPHGGGFHHGKGHGGR